MSDIGTGFWIALTLFLSGMIAGAWIGALVVMRDTWQLTTKRYGMSLREFVRILANKRRRRITN